MGGQTPLTPHLFSDKGSDFFSWGSDSFFDTPSDPLEGHATLVPSLLSLGIGLPPVPAQLNPTMNLYLSTFCNFPVPSDYFYFRQLKRMKMGIL